MLILKRQEYRADCTIGILSDTNELLGWTLELPWVENQRNVSCIPGNDHYRLVNFKSQKYGWVYMLADVPGRSGILIHAGNTAEDTKGCILPGKEVGWLNGKRAVLRSREALTMLRAREKKSLYIVDRING